jgi:photosystem II stability/assembly factor-like uncharacterized protein
MQALADRSTSQGNTPSAPLSASSTVVSKPLVPLTALRMLDSSNGWALSSRSILQTTDGGIHWDDVTPVNAGLNPLARGQFMNRQYAWIAIGPANQQEGSGITILRTTDGGRSWQQIHYSIQ